MNATDLSHVVPVHALVVQLVCEYSALIRSVVHEEVVMRVDRVASELGYDVGNCFLLHILNVSLAICMQGVNANKRGTKIIQYIVMHL